MEGHTILQQELYKEHLIQVCVVIFTGNNEPGPRKCIDCKKSYKSCDCKVTSVSNSLTPWIKQVIVLKPWLISIQSLYIYSAKLHLFKTSILFCSCWSAPLVLRARGIVCVANIRHSDWHLTNNQPTSYASIKNKLTVNQDDECQSRINHGHQWTTEHSSLFFAFFGQLSRIFNLWTVQVSSFEARK